MTYSEWVEWRNDYFKLNNNFNEGNLHMSPEETKKTKENCKSLLNDIILTAQDQDEAHKVAAIKVGKGSQAIGESWMVFHLKALKEHLDAVL
jgi:hypothetical protein